MPSKRLGKPESNSDVINKQPKVLLIGYGWVNQYLSKYFTTAHYLEHDGVIKTVRGNEIVFDPQETNLDFYDERYELAIISVPTPMNQETGQCDTSIVEKMVEKYRNNVDIFLIKSTVEIGTSRRLEETYGVPVCMSPEYVGETLGHPLLEPRRDAFQIIGGGVIAREAVARMFTTVLHASAPIHLVSHDEAEIIKYCENMWIMQRVDYWNDVFDICNTIGVSFSQVREGLVLDPRFSRTHSNVYPQNRGWSGKCLPKDMNALAYKMRVEGEPLETVEFQIEKNANKWRKDYNNSVPLKPEKPLWKK